MPLADISPENLLIFFILLGSVFLGLIALIAGIALWRRSRKKKDSSGGCSSCFLTIMILFFLAVGLGGCTTLVLFAVGSTAVHHGPVRSVEFDWDTGQDRDEDWDDWSWRRDRDRDEYPVQLRVELEGDIDVGRLSSWLRERVDGDFAVSTTHTISGRSRRTQVEFDLPIERGDLEDLRQELREALDDLDLPRGVRIEIRDR